ncbi:MAG: flagellar basal body protein [Pseudomonadota bacterium]
MESVAEALIVKALDGLAMRSSVTAQNIANANTEGYRPMAVSFEEALAEAAPRGMDAIRAVAPRVDYAPVRPEASGAMRLDLEIATAAGTSTRYSALVEMLNRQLQLKSLAVTGGR